MDSQDGLLCVLKTNAINIQRVDEYLLLVQLMAVSSEENHIRKERDVNCDCL